MTEPRAPMQPHEDRDLYGVVSDMEIDLRRAGYLFDALALMSEAAGEDRNAFHSVAIVGRETSRRVIAEWERVFHMAAQTSGRAR